MTKLAINFIKERETKGAVRYTETDADGEVIGIPDGALVGTLYVRKATFAGVIPGALAVTIDY